MIVLNLMISLFVYTMIVVWQLNGQHTVMLLLAIIVFNGLLLWIVHHLNKKYFRQTKQQMLDGFIQIIPMPTAVYDRQSNLVMANERFINGNFQNIQHDELLRIVFQGDQVQAKPYKQGQQSFLSHAVPLRDLENNIVAGLLFYQDTTEISDIRNELDHMGQLRLVGQMAASITHEIRNPLAVVRGFIQLMMNKNTNENNKQYYTLIMDEMDRANGLVNDFLSLSQTRILDKSIYNISELTEELAPLLRADANMRGIMLEMELADDLPGLVVNPKEIRQLIINVARNGMDAMQQGGTLTISTEHIKDQIVLRIKDTGIGMSEEVLNQLFNPFYTTKKSGTGLGLSVCQSIVEKHNGKIQVQTAINKGTVFSILFPLQNEQQITDN